MTTRLIPVALLLACFGGCIKVTTESEIKPIHITMDINLKVDKSLDQAFSDESRTSAPQGDFAVIKAMLDRQAAGVTSLAMLEAREKATDDDRLTIAEANAKRLRRFSTIAKESNVSLETVQRRYAAKMRSRIPEGSGVWYQDENGIWRQR